MRELRRLGDEIKADLLDEAPLDGEPLFGKLPQLVQAYAGIVVIAGLLVATAALPLLDKIEKPASRVR